jgi:endonuclease/exonuclease/phosphatase family metal-dependent hydrolase
MFSVHLLLPRSVNRCKLFYLFLAFLLVTGVAAFFNVGLPCFATVGPSVAPVLTADKLEGFSKTPQPPLLLNQTEQELRTVWQYAEGPLQVKPLRHPVLGPLMRVSSWNIERGNVLKPIIMWLTHPGSANTPESRAAAEWLSESDVWLFSEVDWGMGRTDYQNITQVLAKQLHMHAVFAPEFIELAPFFRESHSDETHKPIDKSRYLGLHGGAILSHYPIIESHSFRLPECYDWFDGERKKLSELEKLRRTATNKIFDEDIFTEVRYGGRMALLATLEVPALQGIGKVTVVQLHLENRCAPACRQKQMNALLAHIKGIRHPVIMGGDWNTSGTDVSPTSISKELRNRLSEPAFWSKQAISWLVPFGLPINIGLNGFQYVKNLYNPTATNIPLIAPNKEEALFEALKSFRFDDGTTFDFRGDSERSFEKSGLLSNSNQRWLKGFVPTFSLNRPLFKGAVGRYKLDWIVVKSFNGLSEGSQDYRFAPHFGRTHVEVNKAAKQLWGAPLSDHDPMSIDLPFNNRNDSPTKMVSLLDKAKK